MFIFKSTRKPCTHSNRRNIPAIFVKQLTRCPWPWRDISRWNMDFTTRMKNSILVNIVAGDMLRALCWGNTCCLMVLMETNLKIKTKLGLLWNKSYLKLSTFTQKVKLKLLGQIKWKNTKKVDPFQNWFFVISDHYWTGLGWFKPFFAFRGPIGAVGGQFWVLGVLKGRKFEISKLDHFWPWDATFLT